jgi:hypothetical protein
LFERMVPLTNLFWVCGISERMCCSFALVCPPPSVEARGCAFAFHCGSTGIVERGIDGINN